MECLGGLQNHWDSRCLALIPAKFFFSFWFLPPLAPQPQYQNGESEENHEQFLKALQNSVTTFLNRMKSNHMRGRSITNDSSVLSLFQSINNMHPQLLDILNQLDEKRCGYRAGGVRTPCYTENVSLLMFTFINHTLTRVYTHPRRTLNTTS